jgi:hypothetical protein
VLLSYHPNKASELGRIGGKSKRYKISESADPLPTLENATAVRDAVARLIADVYAGRIHPRMAAGLAPLITLQLHAIETADLEQRLTQVEKRLPEADAEAKSSRRISTTTKTYADALERGSQDS